MLIAFTASGNENNHTKKVEIGTYNISLSVADVNESMAFYSKLGFDLIPNAGSPEQKWVLMSNGKTKNWTFSRSISEKYHHF